MPCEVFSLTAVHYAKGDPFGDVMALASLAPMFIIAQTVALIAVRRDWQTLMFLTGLILNVLANKFLKDFIGQARPSHLFCGGDSGSVEDSGAYEDSGMPSNHAQFMSFVAMIASLFLIVRVRAPRLELLAWSLSAWLLAVTTGYSRIHLGYHTQEQVAVGFLVGALLAGVWFVVYLVFLERLGRYLVRTWLFRCFLIRETSSVQNVLVAEYKAFHNNNDDANSYTASLITDATKTDGIAARSIGSGQVSHLSIALSFKIEKLLNSMEDVAKSLTPGERAQFEASVSGVFSKLG